MNIQPKEGSNTVLVSSLYCQIIILNCVYLTLTQRDYAKKILKMFGMTECSGAKTPVDPTLTAKLSLADCPAEVNADLQKEYRAKVGSLQHLSIWTRPDL